MWNPGPKRMKYPETRLGRSTLKNSRSKLQTELLEKRDKRQPRQRMKQSEWVWKKALITTTGKRSQLVRVKVTFGRPQEMSACLSVRRWALPARERGMVTTFRNTITLKPSIHDGECSWDPQTGQMCANYKLVPQPHQQGWRETVFRDNSRMTPPQTRAHEYELRTRVIATPVGLKGNCLRGR